MRMIQAPIHCAHCGTRVVPRRSDRRYCDVRCRVAAYRQRKRAAQ